MATAHEIQVGYYDQGRYQAALELCVEALGDENRRDDRVDLIVLKAWCLYRIGKFDEARTCATSVRDDPWAQECLLALAAKDGDDELLMRIAAELGDTCVVLSALIIRALADNSKLMLDPLQLFHRLHSVRGEASDVQKGNLFNNAGFLCFKLPEGSNTTSYLLFGFAWLHIALHYYGETNWHHRAGAHYRLSLLLDKLGLTDQATAMLVRCAALWDQALARDPNNTTYQVKRDDVRALADARRGIPS